MQVKRQSAQAPDHSGVDTKVEANRSIGIDSHCKTSVMTAAPQPVAQGISAERMTECLRVH
jgi:hypothetical protein